MCIEYRHFNEEQAKAVSDVLHSSPLIESCAAVLCLTGLSMQSSMHAVRGSSLAVEVTKYPLDTLTLLANLADLRRMLDHDRCS